MSVEPNQIKPELHSQFPLSRARIFYFAHNGEVLHGHNDVVSGDKARGLHPQSLAREQLSDQISLILGTSHKLSSHCSDPRSSDVGTES